MSQHNLTSTKGQFTGWHMLTCMVAFFGVIISVNIFMAISATRTWTGLVVDNAYVQSQGLNDKLSVSKLRSEKGWNSDITLDNGSLHFQLKRNDNTPITVQAVYITIHRPIGTKDDRTLTLYKDDNGTFSVPLTLPKGVWIADITAKIADEPDYEHHARFLVD